MTRLSVGDPAPLFELPDTDGAASRLEPAAHAATVVVFTAERLPVRPRLARPPPGRRPRLRRPRRRRPPDRQQRRRRPPRGLRRGDAARVAAGELAGPFLRDAEQSAAQAYGATATPEVFVIDRDGVVRYHGAPDGDYDDPAQDAAWLREALDDVLAGREVARPTTSPAGCSIKWRVELLWWEGCPTHGEAAELLRADPRRDRQGRRARRPARGADPRRRRAARLPGLPDLPGRRPRPLPDRRGAGPDLPRLPARRTAAAAPLPDAADLADRLRDVLARPWELPGWVDFRKQRPAADLVLTATDPDLQEHPWHRSPSTASPSGTRTGPRPSPSWTWASGTASSSSWSARPAAARRRRCAWRPASRRSPTAGC